MFNLPNMSVGNSHFTGFKLLTLPVITAVDGELMTKSTISGRVETAGEAIPH